MSVLVGLPARGEGSPGARYQKLSPHPNGLPREQVAAHQRERLRRAMVEAVARDGYGATTVGQLCALASVSKRAFYELFTGKPDCFEFAYEQVVCRAVERVVTARGGCRDGHDALRAALRELMDGVARNPAAASFALVHALDATPVGLERREWAAGLFEEALVGCLADDEPALCPAIRRGIVAGVAAVVRARLLDGRASELPGLADELADWAWRCARCAAAAAARQQLRERLDRRRERPALRLVEQARRTEGWRGGGAEPSVRDERTLLFESAIALTARGGMLALTPDALEADSGVPRRRVHALFESPDRCLLEALSHAGEDHLTGALQAGAGTERRQAAVRRSVVALLRGLAEDRALARALFVEALALGPRAIELREPLCARAARALADSVPDARRSSTIACEAGAGAVWGIIERHVAKGATARLPRLAAPAYLLLLDPLREQRRTGEAIVTDDGAPDVVARVRSIS